VRGAGLHARVGDGGRFKSRFRGGIVGLGPTFGRWYLPCEWDGTGKNFQFAKSWAAATTPVHRTVQRKIAAEKMMKTRLLDFSDQLMRDAEKLSFHLAGRTAPGRRHRRSLPGEPPGVID